MAEYEELLAAADRLAAIGYDDESIPTVPLVASLAAAVRHLEAERHADRARYEITTSHEAGTAIMEAQILREVVAQAGAVLRTIAARADVPAFYGTGSWWDVVLIAARVSHSRRWMAPEPAPNWFDGEILDAEIVD